MTRVCGSLDMILVSIFVPILLAVPPSLAFAASSSSPPSSMSSDLAVVGCGVLGTSLCRQLLASPDFASRKITGITKTKNRHESIYSQVLSSTSSEAEALATSSSKNFDLKTSDEIASDTCKFKDVVFCAPPSGFEDYPAALEDSITNLWEGPSGGGVFVFTSSGGIYGKGDDGGTVGENSPTADPKSNPRTARLLSAEQVCAKHGGCSLRLAGLYTVERGAHNYWLEGGGGRDGVQGREDGIINLLHYDDAASACIAAIKAGSSVVSGKIFLISDGNPTTRKGICESAMKASRYGGRKMPTFLGGEDDPLGKVYDGSKSNDALKWSPKYASFDEYMASQ